MNARDIRLVQITGEYPEQYKAYDHNGNQIGYVRIRWGYCVAWCPDESSDTEVYVAKLKNGWWNFGNNREQKKHLRRAKAAIAAWANQETPE